jgi:hypothetical protein
MQDALPKQVKLGPPVPPPFDQLHPTALPFTWTRAPDRGEDSLNSIIILAEAPGDRPKRRELRGLRRLEPWLKRGRIAHSMEGLKVGLEFVPLGKQGIDLQERREGIPLRLSLAIGREQHEP